MSVENGLVNPFVLSDGDGYMWLKGNLHSHSTNSDGRVSPQERVDGYVNQGYDYLCVSDHNNITFVETLTCPENFTLIQGAELHPDNPLVGTATTLWHSIFQRIWMRGLCPRNM